MTGADLTIALGCVALITIGSVAIDIVLETLAAWVLRLIERYF